MSNFTAQEGPYHHPNPSQNKFFLILCGTIRAL